VPEIDRANPAPKPNLRPRFRWAMNMVHKRPWGVRRRPLSSGANWFQGRSKFRPVRRTVGQAGRKPWSRHNGYRRL